jgi:hypothetical protein
LDGEFFVFVTANLDLHFHAASDADFFMGFGESGVGISDLATPTRCPIPPDLKKGRVSKA